MSTVQPTNQSANAAHDALQENNKRQNSPSVERADHASLDLPYCPPFGYHPSFEYSYYPSSESCAYVPQKVGYRREGSCDSDESSLERSYPSTPEQYYSSATSCSSLSENTSSPNTPYFDSLPYRPSAINNSPYLQAETVLKPIPFADGKALPSRPEYFCVPGEVTEMSDSPGSLGVHAYKSPASAPVCPTSSSGDPIVSLCGAVAAPRIVSSGSAPSAADDHIVSQSTASLSSLGLSSATSSPQTNPTSIAPSVSLVQDALATPQSTPAACTPSISTDLGVPQNALPNPNSFPGSIDSVSAPQNLCTHPSSSSPSSSASALALIPVERTKLAPSRAINGVISFPIVRPSCSLTLSLKPVSPWASTSKKRSIKGNKENVKPLAWS